MDARRVEAMIQVLKADLAKAEKSQDRVSIASTRAKLTEMNRKLDEIEKALRDA